MADSWMDTDGVLHYNGSPTVALPETSHWLFRLDAGDRVSTFFQGFRRGEVTPYIRLMDGEGGISATCRGCSDEEIDFENVSKRLAKWECDPEPPKGVKCGGYVPARGKRLRFEKEATVSISVNRTK